MRKPQPPPLTADAQVWRRIRRPFRYPCCAKNKCQWELFGPDQAGCLKCGSVHQCFENQVDNVCPLATLDDCSRACTITGIVVREVRHAASEYTDTCSVPLEYRDDRSCLPPDLDADIYNAISYILLSDKANKYRNSENNKVSSKLAQSLHKSLKAFKMKGSGGLPVLHTHLAWLFYSETNVRFIQEASHDLVNQCARVISQCIVDLHKKGIKITPGVSLQNLVVGLMYLLRTGLTYEKHVLLPCIEEVALVLPNENRLENVFGISCKSICIVENITKYLWRNHLQERAP